MEAKTQNAEENFELELRSGLTIKPGLYLQKTETPLVIEIENLAYKDSPNLGVRHSVFYRVHNLRMTTVSEIQRSYWENFQKIYQNAEVLTLHQKEKIWKEAMQPIPVKEREKMEQDIRSLIKTEALEAASLSLTNYFKVVVTREPEYVKTWFYLRAAIPHKRHRPCLCLSDLLEEVREAFFERLKQHLLDYMPETKFRRLTNRSDYTADPDDKHLKDLIKPFVSREQLRPAMWGVNFSDKGTAVTDAHRLLFLPKIKNGKKGTYCMARKCFKDNDNTAKIDQRYPDYQAILPQSDTTFTSFILRIDELRHFIKNMEQNGVLVNSKTVRINFIYDQDKYLRFDATKILLPIIETLGKLGHERIKIWIQNHKSAVVFTGEQASRKDISAKSPGELILGMPLFAGNNKEAFQKNLEYGDSIWDLDKGQYWLYGAAQKARDFTVSPIKKATNKTQLKMQKLALMQSQQIAILEMEKAQRAA